MSIGQVQELVSQLWVDANDFAAANPKAAIAAGIVGLVVLMKLVQASQNKRDLAAKRGLLNINTKIANVRDKVDTYTSLHTAGGGSAEEREERCQEMVNQYYDLSTDFYLFGWGNSFHFANRWNTETLQESIVRHEHFLAAAAELKPGMHAVDVGCGIGGPARNIARYSRAQVTGVNNNQYQVDTGSAVSIKEGVSDLVKLVKADFMHLPFSDETFDAAYAIEATCHAADRTGCYAEVFRTLKPGSVFAGFEWCLTEKYNGGNGDHVNIKAGIEIGNGLPDIISCERVVECLKEAGFEVEQYEDLRNTGQLPWYHPFVDVWSVKGFQLTAFGIWLTHLAVTILEFLWIAPSGTTKAHANLVTGAQTLTAGGEKGIFTPMFFFKARKPAAAPKSAAAAASDAKPRGRSRSASRPRRS